MKNLELQSLGLMELDTKEMVEMEGGIVWFIVGAVLLLTASSCNNHVENKLEVHVHTHIKADSNNVHVGSPHK